MAAMFSHLCVSRGRSFHCAAVAGPRVAGITEVSASDAKAEENPLAGIYTVRPELPLDSVFSKRVLALMPDLCGNPTAVDCEQLHGSASTTADVRGVHNRRL